MAADLVADETGLAEFGILGPLEVRRSGTAVPLGGPRQRAVLALLLLEANRVVSMDRLAEGVWGGDPPAGWVTTLQTYVFHLRRALEPHRSRGAAGGVLVTSGRGYLLRVDRERLDAALFQDWFTEGRAALEAGRPSHAAETLRAALRLWRGQVLADLADYAFVQPEAARLDDLRLAALESRIDADLALGRHDVLTAELERLAADYPLRERLHGQLMLALYRCGRQGEALAAYRRVRDLLADELGIDPGEPLRRLHAFVLAHDPSLDWEGAAPAQDQSRPAQPGDPRTSQHATVISQGPGRSWPRPVAGARPPAWMPPRLGRWAAAGAALAVIASAGAVVAVRPWAHASTVLPGNSVGLIDASRGQVGEPVTVDSPGGLAYGDGSVWAVDTTDGTLSRINPATHAVVQQIPVGAEPAAVTVSPGDNVWVTNSGDGTVSRVNAAAGRVVQTIAVGNVPVAIASGPSGVWVANQGDGTVYQINPASGTVTRKVPVGGLPDGVAVGPAAIWVANSQDGTVTRIDPDTGQPSGPLPVGAGPAGIAVTPTGVWVANSLDLTVSRLDPVTGRVTATIDVGDGPGTIVAAGNTIWVSDQFNATIDRIDPHANRVAQVISVGSSPQGIAAAGPGIWVAARPFAAAGRRGGTLTEVADTLPPRDPVLAYDALSIPVLGTVYDGLVALRRTGGAAGFTLVPDLARTLPRPGDGGTTYTFTLRRGIRYSTGTLVRASDLRRGIQRQLSFGANPAYYEGILGAHACLRHGRRCNLSAGIATDDAAGTITFHLSQADPDFLYKLALLLAVPAPPGAPSHAIDQAPFLPGTGPYKISNYQPGRSLTLDRNPHFHQWSYAAQPAGYPNRIRFEQVASPRAQQSAVAAGRADLVDIIWNNQPYQPLALRYPARVHPGLKTYTWYLFLNTHLPPFTNLQARQAVNYGVDRARVIELLDSGPGQDAVTCQILPAGSPSYQRYCPYTIGPQDGGWHGPDLARARQLVKRSGTAGVPVTVWNFLGRPVGSSLTRLLDRLGYRAKLREVSISQLFNAILNPRNQVQAGLVSWGADFPTASDFFLPVLTCHSGFNAGQYCNHHIDTLASRAQGEQLTNPAAARALWGQIDRLVTGQAPWVPIFNQAPTVFVSSRVGNYQDSPYYGPLLDQIWVR